MEAAASVIAIVQISTAVITACNKYLRTVHNARDDIQRFKDGIEAYLQTIEKLRGLIDKANGDKLEVISSLRGMIGKSEVALKEIEIRLADKGNNPIRRLGLKALKWPLNKGEVDEAVRNLGEWKSTLTMALLTDNFSQTLKTAQSVDRQEQSRNLDKLPRVVDAEFDSRSQQHDPQCLPGTRTGVLQRLTAWSTNPDSEAIFWLRGMAGTGKSTIGRTFARQLHEERRLAGSFFFARGGGDRGHAGKLITTLAIQLARRVPELKGSIYDVVKEDEDITHRGLGEQFRRLILEPVRKLSTNTTPSLVFVIDALDECDGEEDIEIVPQLLATLASVRSTIRLQALIIGRPERTVRRGFLQLASQCHHEFDLFDMDEAVVKEDITLMIVEELKTVRSRHGLPDSWPRSQDQVVDTLSTKAGSLFIYAKTVCRFILDSSLPQRALKLATEDTSLPTQDSPTAILDAMYMTILQDSYVGDSVLFKKIIGSIVLARTQFSIIALSRLLGVDESVISSVLHNLHSVMHVPTDNEDHVHLLHPSFRDFLLDDERCTDCRFQLQTIEAHRFLANSCMHLMQQDLKSDICYLELPDCYVDQLQPSQIADDIQVETSYACRNWAYHVCAAEYYDPVLIHRFMASRLFQWIEALALLNDLPSSIYMIQDLQGMRSLKLHPVLQETLYDVYRYLMYHRSILEAAPLQVYHSAALFSPRTGFAAETCAGRLHTVVVQSGPVPSRWSSCLQVWEASHPVISLPASIIASITSAGIEIREIATGRCVSTLIIEQTTDLDMDFSLDGSLLLIVKDGSVWIWNIRLGDCTYLHDKSGSTTSAKFGDNDSKALTTHGKGFVVVWDVVTGTQLHLLEGHSGPVRYAEFSTDGKQIVSASQDGSVRIWNAETGTAVHTLGGHITDLDRARFMHKAGCVVSCSSVHEHTITFWNTETGACIHVLEKSTGIAISPDGSMVACTKLDGTIEIWDPAIPACLKTLRDFSGELYAEDLEVEVSADGERLMGYISGSKCCTWSTTTGNTLSTFRIPQTRVGFLTKGGTQFYQADLQTTSIWNREEARAVQETDQSAEREVTFIKRFKDGSLLLSGDSGGRLKIWDTSTFSCTQIESLGNLELSEMEVQASADGKIIVGWTAKNGLMVLRTNEGIWNKIPTSTEYYMASLGISSKGRYVTYDDNAKVYVQSVQTGEVVANYAVRETRELSIVFSPHNEELITILEPSGMARACNMARTNADSTASNEDILWLQAITNSGVVFSTGDGVAHVTDTQTGQLLSTIEGLNIAVSQTKHTLDGEAIIVRDRGSVQSWSLETGNCEYTVNVSAKHRIDILLSPTPEIAVVYDRCDRLLLWRPKTDHADTICLKGAGATLDNGLAFQQDGTHMVTGCKNGTLKVLDIERQQWQTVARLSAWINDAAFSPDGRKIVVQIRFPETQLQVWDLPSKCCLVKKKIDLTSLRRHNPFSPCSTKIAYRDGKDIKILSIDDDMVLQTLAHAADVTFITWSPDGKILASGSFDSGIRLWNAETGICTLYIADIGTLRDMGFSRDGAMLYYASSFEKTAKAVIMNVENGECISSLPAGDTRLIDARFSVDNELLALIKEDDELEIWNVNKDQRLCAASLSHGQGKLSPDASLVLGEDYVWDYQKQKILDLPPTTFHGTHRWAEQVDSPLLVSEPPRRSIARLDLQTATMSRIPIEDINLTYSDCSHRSGLIVFAVRRSNSLCIWDIIHNRPYASYHSVSDVNMLRFSSDGTTIVGVGRFYSMFSCSIDGGIQDEKVHFSEYLGRVQELYPSQSAKIVAVRYDERLLVIWHMKRCECISTVQTHDDWARRPSFSEEHNLVTAISEDNAIRVWNMETFELIAYFPSSKPIYSASITPDGLSVEVNDGLTKSHVFIQDGAPPPSIAHYWIGENRRWIMWKQHGIIYIPQSYRSTHVSIYNDVVTLVPESGDPMFLRLDRDMDPRTWSFDDPLVSNPELWITEGSLAEYLRED